MIVNYGTRAINETDCLYPRTKLKRKRETALGIHQRHRVLNIEPPEFQFQREEWVQNNKGSVRQLIKRTALQSFLDCVVDEEEEGWMKTYRRERGLRPLPGLRRQSNSSKRVSKRRTTSGTPWWSESPVRSSCNHQNRQFVNIRLSLGFKQKEWKKKHIIISPQTTTE